MMRARPLGRTEHEVRGRLVKKTLLSSAHVQAFLARAHEVVSALRYSPRAPMFRLDGNYNF